MISVKYAKANPDSKFPTKAEDGSNGYDVYSVEDGVIEPDERKAFDTGLKIELPKGYACLVIPRSGNAIKAGITVVNSPGLIDFSYRGLCKVLLINHSKDVFNVKKGDRIAQWIFVKTEDVHAIEVTETELSVTKRGEGGFGSTGVR